MSGMKDLKQKLGDISAGLVLSFALSFMLCVFAPYELFLTNQGEFWFGADTMILPVILCFVLMLFVLSLFCAVLSCVSRVAYKILLAVYFAVFVLMYVQGNFLVSGLPALDGTQHDWSAPSAERVKSVVAVALCAALSAALLILLKNGLFSKVVMYVGGGVSLMLVFTLVTLVLTTPMVDKSQKLKVYSNGEFEYSSEENFIVFVLDALDAEAFEEAMKRNPEYSDTFDDFTYYNDTLAAYPFTMHSVPMILTGAWHENDRTFDEYLQNGLDSSPLIKKLEAEDYRIGIYEPGVLSIDSKNEGRFENLIADEDTYSSVWSFAGVLAKMTGLKYAPWDLKQFCYDVSEYSESIKIGKNEDGEGHFGWSNKDFYDSLEEEGKVKKTDSKTFRYIHLEGAHVPFKYDKDMNVTDGGTYEDNVDACLTICDRYIKQLKAEGVYDNSVIVILADHGFAAEDKQHLLEDRMNPAMLIKGRGERRESMKISSAPVSYDELAGAFVLLCEGKGADEIFAYKDGDVRERRFIKYYYTCEDDMQEFRVTGTARDLDGMFPTGVYYKLNEQ